MQVILTLDVKVVHVQNRDLEHATFTSLYDKGTDLVLLP